jgi:hypothetical protein
VTRAVAHVLAAVAVIVTCAACGRGSAPKPLPKAAWIARADGICASSQASIKALGSPTDLAAVATYGNRVGDILDQEIAAIRALPAPVGDATTIDRMLTEAHRGVDVARELARIAATGDGSAVQEYAAKSQAATAEARRLAATYGLRVCGQATG